jgi:hypothetical protein
MSKPVLQIAAVGVVGVILWKVLAGPLIGLLFLALKVAFVVGVVMFALWFFKKSQKDEHRDGEAPAE